jgi:hypothetical protein
MFRHHSSIGSGFHAKNAIVYDTIVLCEISCKAEEKCCKKL